MSVGAMAPAAISGIQARIAAIQSRMGVMSTTGTSVSQLSAIFPTGTSSGTSTSFADSLADALGSRTDAEDATSAEVDTASGVGGIASGTATTSGSGAAAVDLAKNYLGVPYLWGGTDPMRGLDCSGLTKLVYGKLGVTLPRVSADQSKVGELVPSLAQARPGDLLFFHTPVTHVAIYAGGSRMVEAPHTGANVRVSDVSPTPSVIRRVLPAAGEQLSTATVTAATTTGTPYASLFRSEGARAGVSPALLAAVAKTESGFRTDAVSPAGAQGLMQIMPATARGLGIDATDPTQAVRGAATLLSGYLKDYDGDVDLSLAAYNAGPGNVRKYGGVPPFAETRAYVSKVRAALQEVSL